MNMRAVSGIFFTLLVLLSSGHVALAATNFGNFEAQLPGVEDSSIDAFVSGDRPLSNYVHFITNIMTATIIVLGLIMIVIGGYFYMLGGSADGAKKGKTFILSALLGITLALTAWILLNVINPAITQVNL